MKILITSLLSVLFVLHVFAQQNSWKKEQVLPTKDLAARLQANSKDLPVIFNVGPMENIKTAIKIGATNTDAGIKNLEAAVAGMNKNKEIIIYCGCCSYSNCPNIVPAFNALQKSGFKNVKVLDIPEGLKQDWVAKGYPTE